MMTTSVASIQTAVVCSFGLSALPPTRIAMPAFDVDDIDEYELDRIIASAAT